MRGGGVRLLRSAEKILSSLLGFDCRREGELREPRTAIFLSLFFFFLRSYLGVD